MKKRLYTAVALLALVGCSEGGDVAQGAYDGEVLLRSSIATRTVGDQWESGDQIGVRMSYGENGESAESAMYTTDPSGVLTSTTPLYYPNERTVNFIAYYPYELFDSECVATVDVTDQSDQGALDVMVAKVEDKYRNADPVELKFKHCMVQVVIGKIIAGEDNADLTGLKVELLGTCLTGTYNILNNSYNSTSEAADLAMKVAADGTSAEAIVRPQWAAMTFRFTTTAQVVYTMTLPEINLAGGTCFKINSVTLHNNKAILGELEINEWGYGSVNGGDIDMRPDPNIYAVGDAYPRADNAFGVVCEVSDGGRHGKMLSTLESSDIYWANRLENTSNADAKSEDDGLANMKAIVADGVEQYEAASYVNNMNGDSKGYASGSTFVWYLPAFNELKSITLAEWDKINATLTTLGYGKVYDQLWTSTLVNNSHARWVDYDDETDSQGTLDSTILKVRAMQRF